MSQRPDCVTDKHLEFLDELRESGKTNMFNARPYLVSNFGDLTKAESLEIVSYWMETFDDPQR